MVVENAKKVVKADRWIEKAEKSQWGKKKHKKQLQQKK